MSKEKKKHKSKSNRAPMIPVGAQFASSYKAAVKDQIRFEESQDKFKRKKIKKLKKGEH